MSAAFYRTAAWRQLRAEVLQRQPVCATAGCGRRSVVADHVTPRSRGGGDELGNLRGLCTPCHNQRRQGGEPRAAGCAPDGTPRDPGHWWNSGKSLGAGGQDRLGPSRRVSFPRDRD